MYVCSCHPSSKKLLHATDRDCYRNLKLVNKQRLNDCAVPHINCNIYNMIPISKAQKTFERRGWETVRTLGSRFCCETVPHRRRKLHSSKQMKQRIINLCAVWKLAQVQFSPLSTNLLSEVSTIFGQPH